MNVEAGAEAGTLCALILMRNSIRRRGLEKTLEEVDGALKCGDKWIAQLMSTYARTLASKGEVEDDSAEKAWLGLVGRAEARIRAIQTTMDDGGFDV